MLIRPHPAHLRQWRAADLSGTPGVALWAREESMNADQGLYDALFHADAVVGLNTSAMIEAGILMKPVHTILADEFTGGQQQTLHFHYLRASNGGLVFESARLETHVAQLADALRGDDRHRQQCRTFVEAFVRPRGIDRPVTPFVVDEIERAARIIKHARRQPAWSHAAALAVRVAVASRRALGGHRAEVRA
jgi:predicted GNAT family acetyltransferase